MSATLDTAPPARAFADQPIWIQVSTDLMTGAAAYFEITISNGGPTTGQALTLTWPGGSITYTAGASIAPDGLTWPTQGGGESLTAYTTRIAEFLRHREDVAAVFRVSIVNAAGGVIRLTRSAVEAFDLSVSETMSNVAVTATDGTAHPPDNLRAYVEVWTDTGSFNTETRLLAQHSPYDAAAETALDLAPAFSHLAPHLPDENTIAPASPSSLSRGVATGHFEKYFLRLADKFGTPAVAEALDKNAGSYLAFLGARATDAETSAIGPLCHAYVRRDGATFVKPVGEYQPDWLYFILPAAGVADVEVALTWSDGTESTYLPFGTADTGWDADKVYWIPCGYRQLKLHTVTPSGSTDDDAYIVAYQVRLPDQEEAWEITADFRLECDTPWEHYLLFSNGVAGMETVALRGKATGGFEATAETFRLPRLPDHTAQRGDLGVFNAAGRPQWTFSTGWFDDPYYVEHLRQVLLAQAWLVDRHNEKFYKVLVDAKTIDQVTNDDETLFALEFTVKAGWLDAAVNV